MDRKTMLYLESFLRLKIQTTFFWLWKLFKFAVTTNSRFQDFNFIMELHCRFWTDYLHELRHFDFVCILVSVFFKVQSTLAHPHFHQIRSEEKRTSLVQDHQLSKCSWQQQATRMILIWNDTLTFISNVTRRVSFHLLLLYLH